MATIYCYHTGNNTTGASWATAKTTLNAALTAAGAGGTVYVSHSHGETGSGVTTVTSPGTFASPTIVLCVDDAAEPPTTLATGAEVGSGNGWELNLGGGVTYVYGVTFVSDRGRVAGNYAPTMQIGTVGGCYWHLDNCTLRNDAGGAPGSSFSFGYPASSNLGPSARLTNCTLKAYVAASRGLMQVSMPVVFDGGSLDVSSSVPTNFICPGAGNYGATAAGVSFIGFDLSGMGSGKTIVKVDSYTQETHISFDQCRLGASVTLVSATYAGAGGPTAIFRNCNSGAVNYHFFQSSPAGDITVETTVVKSSGATDGTTPISWKMSTNTNALYPIKVLRSQWMEVWNDSTGTKTITVDIAHDSGSAALKDDECWMEFMYLGSSSYPKGTFDNDAKVGYLTTAADQDTSGATWTGITTPVKQKLHKQVTVNMKGPIAVRVVLAKASKTIYVDPKITVS